MRRPGRGSPRTASGVSTRPSGSVTELAALQRAALGTGGHAERVGRVDVEPAGPRVLDDRVAERRDPVVNRERENPVAVALERFTGAELLDLDRVAQLADHAFEARRTGRRARAGRTASAGSSR